MNHIAEVSVSDGRVDVHYVLDQAEIPTFQERGVAQGGARAAQARRGAAAAARHRRRPAARADPGTPTLALRPGAGGLQTTRFELSLGAACTRARRGARRHVPRPRRLARDRRAARPRHRRALERPATDPTHGLTRYPKDAISSPADIRSATLDARPGQGTVSAPGADAKGGANGSGRIDGLSSAFADAAAGRGVLILLLLAAFGWGAVHALSPATARRWSPPTSSARAAPPATPRRLGATVTVTHTAGVLLLGVVAPHAVGVRAARAAVSVAEPRLGAARRRGRRRRLRAPRAQAARRTRTTITTTRRTCPPAASSPWARRPG
jgi:hypothetical protein